MKVRPLFLLLPLVYTGAVIAFASCSDGPRPPPAGLPDGNPAGDGSPFVPPQDAGSDRSIDTDSGTPPKECTNTIRDGAETDVDCGGNVCPKCIDGMKCIAATDCAGGACLNGTCVTPKCTDVQTNGDETDTDCGGTVCARCTIGKRCKEGKDCVSGACNQDACVCPKGMTTVSRAGGGGAYCVDSLEVNKFEYNKFINANVPIDDQIAVCKPPGNTTFVPRGAWPPQVAPPAAPPGQGLAFNYSMPVHYVDWCDAYAYCKWAKKQLCGSIVGGAVDPAKANSADAGAWYNACSAQGNLAFPYGNGFDINKCNGDGIGVPDAGRPYQGPLENPPIGQGFGYSENGDDGLHQLHNGDVNGSYSVIYFGACFGGSTDLYQMSGNVAEWEDSCDGTLATSKCRVRGGSYATNNTEAAMRCDAVRSEVRQPTSPEVLKDIGFRCCLY